ncbi:unnamed protein product [Symbiodinium sp. CCMP2592]|nr:unnamed protein product [Symbiodinium sp. CCMP2592]
MRLCVAGARGASALRAFRRPAVQTAFWTGRRHVADAVERMGTCAELGCGPNALSGHSKSGDVLGLTNEKQALTGNIEPPITVKGDEFSTHGFTPSAVAVA